MSTQKAISGGAMIGSPRATGIPAPHAKLLFFERAEQEVSQRAFEVIGDKDEALRWLGTPVRALDYATPISLLGNDAGRSAVLAVLGRLEHGVL